jgi:hypothetical protein
MYTSFTPPRIYSNSVTSTKLSSENKSSFGNQKDDDVVIVPSGTQTAKVLGDGAHKARWENVTDGSGGANPERITTSKPRPQSKT